MKKLFAMAALVACMPAHAGLTDVAGTDYNYDAGSGLYWRDVGATKGLTFDAAASDGWRHASGGEISSLFASNLSGFETFAPSGVDSALGDYAGGTSAGTAGSLQAVSFQEVLGGITHAIQGQFDLVGTFDRASTNGGHALASVSFAGGGWSATLGGTFPGVGDGGGGHWLVSTVPPVPEPGTYALMGLGLLGLWAARRRKQ